MAFTLTSRNIRLAGLNLYAECRAVNGRWDANTIDLSDYIVTVGGRLYWRIDAEDGLRLGHDADCHLDENYLTARVLEGDRIVESSINLDDCLSNSDGHLHFRPWHTTGRRKQLQETARKIRDLYKSLPPFSYRSLSHSQSIRLLRLSPPTASSYRSCKVVCQLVEFPLTSAPVYSALSYTWGNPHTNGLDEGDPYNRTLPIECNGQLLEVGQNLHKVLRKIGKTLLEEEADLEDGETVLIYWAKRGRLDNVLHWLRRGADVTTQDMFGKSALHWAAKHGHLDVVKVLVFAGSSRTALDDSLKTPLDCAREGQRDDWEAIESFLAQPLSMSTSLCLSRGYGEYYWIDAICINQVDQAEKSTQIALMGSIYKNAKRVLAWIGSDNTCWFQQNTRTMLWHAWRLDEARQMGYLTEEVLDSLVADPIAYNNTSNPVRTLWRTLSKIDTDIEDALELPDAAAYNSFLCWLRHVILMDIARPKLYMDVPKGAEFLSDVHGDYEPVEPWDFFDYAFRDHGRTTRRTRMATFWQLCKRVGIPLPDMPVCEINSEVDVTYYYNVWIQNVLGAVQFVAHDTSIVPGQKLFRTGKYKKLGSGPGVMEAGDVIMYVPDTVTPYVFREKEDRKYWLIGEAYVHGVPQKPEQYDGKLKTFFDSGGVEFGESICII
ncbi:hypothetical protein E8E12_006218 [Didymella heteroderae]|uniref:Cyanovirin-N domain-containing protein n=1 Tax=Didymella heteroderae TaxID=1769908 RepID=A0A9P4WLL9_9PLEO|nr:hypothetical protein E8E12_006218 [Didymella heteroderae]